MITFLVGPNIWCYSCGVLAENGLKPFKLDILEILFIFLSCIYIRSETTTKLLCSFCQTIIYKRVYENKQKAKLDRQ